MSSRIDCRDAFASQRCLSLHVRQDVRVNLHRHRDFRVPEPLTDDVDRLSRLRSVDLMAWPWSGGCGPDGK
jgi:hypothetical protein